MISLILVLLFTKLIFRDYYFYGGYGNGCHDCYNPKLSIETNIEGDNNKVDVSVSIGSNNVCPFVSAASNLSIYITLGGEEFKCFSGTSTVQTRRGVIKNAIRDGCSVVEYSLI